MFLSCWSSYTAGSAADAGIAIQRSLYRKPGSQHYRCTIAALFFLLLGAHFIGMYFSMSLFLLFYLKVWAVTAGVDRLLSLATPTWLFFFFRRLCSRNHCRKAIARSCSIPVRRHYGKGGRLPWWCARHSAWDVPCSTGFGPTAADARRKHGRFMETISNRFWSACCRLSSRST